MHYKVTSAQLVLFIGNTRTSMYFTKYNTQNNKGKQGLFVATLSFNNWWMVPRVHENQSVQLGPSLLWVSVTAEFRDYIIFGADLRREMA